jgi:hypothetical protein
MKTSKRINEPTPSGGVYSITYFKDANGRPCTEKVAVHYEIVEYDERDNEIGRTYA